MASKPKKEEDQKEDNEDQKKSEESIFSAGSEDISGFWEKYLDGKAEFTGINRAFDDSGEKPSLNEVKPQDNIGPMYVVPDRLVTVNLRDIEKIIRANSPDNDKIPEICAEIAEKSVSEITEIEGGPVKRISRAKQEGRPEWKTRDRSLGEEAGAFVDRVYGDLIRGDAVFHTGTLQSYDKSLSVAYDRWIVKVNEGKAEPLPGHPLPDSGRVRVGGDESRPPPTDEDRRWVLRHLARERKATGRTP